MRMFADIKPPLKGQCVKETKCLKELRYALVLGRNHKCGIHDISSISAVNNKIRGPDPNYKCEVKYLGWQFNCRKTPQNPTLFLPTSDSKL